MKDNISRSFRLVLIVGAFFALVDTGTPAGDTAVQKERRAINPAEQNLNFKNHRLSVWQWKSGGELTLFANGEARHTEWPAKGTWQTLNGGTLLLTHPNGLNFFVTFRDGKNALIVSAKGGRTTIALRE